MNPMNDSDFIELFKTNPYIILLPLLVIPLGIFFTRRNKRIYFLSTLFIIYGISSIVPFLIIHGGLTFSGLLIFLLGLGAFLSNKYLRKEKEEAE